MSNFFYEEEEAAMPYNPDDPMTNDSTSASTIASVKLSHEHELLAIDGVEGVGIGQNEIGDQVILVYLRDAAAENRIPQKVEGFAVRTQITGIIDAY